MATAIGVLDRDVSGDRHGNDRTTLRAAAEAAGHTLATIVEIDAETYMPTVGVLEQLHRHRAVVVIAPSVDHVWAASRALTEHARVIVCDPYEVWPRGHRRPSIVPAAPMRP
ncbi:hypothetical protein [Nocardia shimofusensis]|uniref:hypothetical protein n=1 Tax=Nocardia shimofusensis TaxID=228596 RepID=UPI00082B4045|nr:hypothetical protein [Nocardia shimofusensis]